MRNGLLGMQKLLGLLYPSFVQGLCIPNPDVCCKIRREHRHQYNLSLLCLRSLVDSWMIVGVELT